MPFLEFYDYPEPKGEKREIACLRHTNKHVSSTSFLMFFFIIIYNHHSRMNPVLPGEVHGMWMKYYSIFSITGAYPRSRVSGAKRSLSRWSGTPGAGMDPINTMSY